MMPNPDTETDNGMRLDKWLWCARFYKTRVLATDAIRIGRVLVNEARVKPSKVVHAGDHLRISKAPYQYDVIVTALSPSRKSPATAALLYCESRTSVERREQLASQLKLDASPTPRTRGRPTKRDRRALMEFKKGE